MATDDPLPRYGSNVDLEKLADDLEAYADKLRNGGAHLMGVSVDHDLNHDEFSRVAVTIRTSGHADIDLFDLPVYGPARYPDNPEDE